jgi:hypothetical protein
MDEGAPVLCMVEKKNHLQRQVIFWFTSSYMWMLR